MTPRRVRSARGAAPTARLARCEYYTKNLGAYLEAGYLRPQLIKFRTKERNVADTRYNLRTVLGQKCRQAFLVQKEYRRIVGHVHSVVPTRKYKHGFHLEVAPGDVMEQTTRFLLSGRFRRKQDLSPTSSRSMQRRGCAVNQGLRARLVRPDCRRPSSRLARSGRPRSRSPRPRRRR